MDFPNSKDVLYSVKGRVATITLNRPERMNAISPPMPRLIRKYVEEAEWDDNVHVIIIQGAEKNAFCAGYDLTMFAEKKMTTERAREFEYDLMVDYKMMYENTTDFMSLFRCNKPTIAKIKGVAVGGGSDIALCCDLVIASDDARIGYPPARVWGIPTTMHWVQRLSAEKAKKMLFTGDLVSGKEAENMGLILQSVPLNEIDEYVNNLAERIAAVPKNQLFMSKFAVNQTIEGRLMESQKIATIFDGFARNSPEGRFFKKRSEQVGFQKAVKERGKNIYKQKKTLTYYIYIDSGKPFIPDSISQKTFRFFRSLSML